MRRTLSVMILALLAGCSSTTGPTAGVRVQTDKRVYGTTGALSVAFTVINTTSAEAALASCGGVPASVLQRRDQAGWTTVTSGICPASLDMAPIALAPGATAAGVVQIDRMGGLFRIVLPGTGVEPETPHAVSPTFEVRWLED